MQILLFILAGAVFAVSLYCWIIILIDAFQFDVWAGVGCLVCGLYWLYYAIFEFEHQKKWPLTIGGVVGVWLAALFYEMAMKVPLGGPAWRWL